jgi:hypothetical protein
MIFSAVDAQKSKSSIVAMKVRNPVLHSISVKTSAFFHVVLIDKPDGVLKLSGETASATAWAVRSSP